MKQYTISGIDHVIRILNQYPQLMSLSSLTPIREIGRQAQEAVAKSGCGCSAGPIYNQNKAVFERALDMMGCGDHLMVKNVLKVDKLCYYAKDNTGQNKLKCV
jgi:hypothetical protein